MEKIKEIQNKVSDFIKKNKKLSIAIMIGSVIFILILLNLDFLQISYYKVTQEPQKIVNVLSKEIKEIENHQKAYFKNGINYLIEDMSEISQKFFEKYYSYLNQLEKDLVLSAYNKEAKFFSSHKLIIEDIASGNKSEEIKKYINRIDVNAFELALIECFGNNIELTQDVATKLYQVLSIYDEKIVMNKFNISMYDLMTFPQMATEDSIAIKLLEEIEPNTVHRILFTELKTEPIDIEVLNQWIDTLNKKKIISTKEYASFTNSYSSIKQLKDEYTQLQYQEVDIKNIKQKIDVETAEYTSKIDKIQKEIETHQKEIETTKGTLSKLKQYKTLEVYIMDYNEDGTYEASIPEKSWFFGTYKPSQDKLKIRVMNTKPDSQGVFTFDVYYQGEVENELPYYVEVSTEEKAKIVQLESELVKIRSLIEQKQAEKAKLEGEVEKIRKANNYEQNNRLLEEVAHKKESVILKLTEKQVEIQNLFGIGQVMIDVDKK